MLAATGDLLLMCDADLSAPIAEIEKLRKWIEWGYDVAIGSRDMPDSVLDPPQPLPRRLASWSLRTIRRRMLLRELHDTQCGFKLFRRDVAREVFARATHDGWLFDCEILGIADKLGYRIREVGVRWRDDRESRVRLLPALTGSISELLAIRRRLRNI
jgi:dolichyl-phosphate beta-glucosyltransferase